MNGQKHKIILDCDLMRHPNSGLYHYCLNLGNYVNRYQESRGIRPMSFYVPGSEKKSFDNPGNCIVERKWHHRFFQPFLWDCAVWHAPFQSGRILPLHHKKIKVVLTIHDLNCLHEDKSAKERRISLQHTQKLVDRADAVVCISRHCRKDVLEHLETGNKAVHVIHNGTHHVARPPVSPSGYCPKAPFIFTMGYVNRKKNFHSLLPLLEGNNMELVVAGRLDEPDYVAGMKQAATDHGIGERLRLLGPVSEEDKAWYFRHCTAFALPSLAEGFGAPVVEAMAFGKPLFLSNLTSLPEIGKDVAFYFRSFDPAHMQDVFNQGMTAYRKNGLSQKIIRRGMDFSWEEKAKEYINVYQSLL